MPARTRHEYLLAVIRRFWSYVDRKGPDECWFWMGTRATPLSCGIQYGYFGAYDEGKTINIRPHRFSYLLTHGDLPDDKVVMHTCDAPLCVNPAHLKLGTQIENVEDMMAKGRVAVGEAASNTKLTREQALYAKNSDESPTELGRRWGVHPTCISAIRSGKNWAHLDSVEDRQ